MLTVSTTWTLASATYISNSFFRTLFAKFNLLKNWNVGSRPVAVSAVLLGAGLGHVIDSSNEFFLLSWQLYSTNNIDFWYCCVWRYFTLWYEHLDFGLVDTDACIIGPMWRRGCRSQVEREDSWLRSINAWSCHWWWLTVTNWRKTHIPLPWSCIEIRMV